MDAGDDRSGDPMWLGDTTDNVGTVTITLHAPDDATPATVIRGTSRLREGEEHDAYPIPEGITRAVPAESYTTAEDAAALTAWGTLWRERSSRERSKAEDLAERLALADVRPRRFIVSGRTGKPYPLAAAELPLVKAYDRLRAALVKAAEVATQGADPRLDGPSSAGESRFETFVDITCRLMREARIDVRRLAGQVPEGVGPAFAAAAAVVDDIGTRCHWLATAAGLMGERPADPHNEQADDAATNWSQAMERWRDGDRRAFADVLAETDGPRLAADLEAELRAAAQHLTPADTDTTAAAASASGVVSASPPACSHGDDFATVDWFGTRYTFGSEYKRQAVRVLWEAWENGGHGVRQTTIGDRIGSAAENFRMGATFRDHPAYGRMIQGDGQGTYRLVPPDADETPQIDG